MKERALFFLLLALLALALFWQLGTHGLTEPDEGRTAGIGVEFYRSDTWLIPRLYDLAQFNKPPLTYWACSISYRIFGVNEWAARLPSALAALGTLLLTRAIARRLYGHREALAATLILLTAPLFFIMAHVIDPNMMLTFWLTLTMWSAIAWFQDGRKIHCWIFYIALALAFLTKGPPALGIIGLALAGFCFSSRLARNGPPVRAPVGERPGGRATPNLEWRPLFNLPAILLCIALALGWFIAVATKYPELWSFFLGQELLGRLTGKISGRAQPIYYFIPILLGGILPWVPVLIAALIAAAKKIRTDARACFLLLWIALPFLLFSLSKSKLPAYILPLLPPLAIVIGAHIVTIADKRWIRFVQIPFAIAIGLALPVLLAMLGPKHFDWPPVSFRAEITNHIPWLAASAVAIALTLAVHAQRRLIGVAAVIVIGHLGILDLIIRHENELDAHSSPKKMCAALQPNLRPGDRVVLFRNAPRGVSFYLRHPLTFSDKYEPQLASDWTTLSNRLYKEDDPGAVYRWVDHEPRVFVITTDHARGGEAGQNKSPLSFLRDGCRKPLREIYHDGKFVVVANFVD